MVDVQESFGKNHGHLAEYFRSRAFAGECRRGTLGGADFMGGRAHIYPASDHHPDGDLWTGSVGATSVARAGAARLSFDLCEAGDNCSAGDRSFRGASQYSVPKLHAVRAWRRPDHQGTTVSISVYHDCLRSYLGVSLAGIVRDDSQNAR